MSVIELIIVTFCQPVTIYYIQSMEVDETSEKAIWNEVSTDFDPDEETANFGTRQALETAGSLYEVSQVDTIETVSGVTLVCVSSGHEPR